MSDAVAKVDYVDAIFGDGLVRFKLGDDDMVMNYALKPNTVFQRLADGSWTSNDIVNVLAFAYPSTSTIRGRLEVRRVLALGKHPMGAYVALAAKILEAYMTRITVDRAMFDEKVAVA